MNKYFRILIFVFLILLIGGVIKGVYILNKQNSEFTKLQSTNKQLSQAIADIRDELLERPIDIEVERAKFAKNLETNLTVEKLNAEQKKEYDLYDSTLKWLKKNGIKVYFFKEPYFDQIKNLDDFYKVKRKQSDFSANKKNGLFEKVFTCKDCADYWKNERKYVQDYFDGKVIKRKDLNLKHVKFINGIRQAYPLDENLPTVHMFGNCVFAGLLSSQYHTIGAFLRNLVKINTMSYGNSWAGDILNAVKYQTNCFRKIRDALLSKGDFVIATVTPSSDVFKLALKNNGIPYFELSQLFDGPNNYGFCFADLGLHPNCTANRVIAKYIYKVIKPEIERYDGSKPRKYIRMDDINDPAEKAEYLKQTPDFKKYLDSLVEIKKKQNIKGNVGSIVMNCNPFTLGHRYLVETAAKQVDKLIIFVVEEDKSDYPFKDRMELVKKGVSDLKNVIVLPSGNFIISLVTFPEYFVKGQKQKDKIDPSKDVSLFAKYIAPTLGIKVRFVGEEPYDTVTKQYNDTMRNFFPTFGLKFVEIKRKSTDGKDDFISASKVRKLLEENKWEELKKYVPETTYRYLEKRKK